MTIQYEDAQEVIKKLDAAQGDVHNKLHSLFVSIAQKTGAPFDAYELDGAIDTALGNIFDALKKESQTVVDDGDEDSMLEEMEYQRQLRADYHASVI